MYYCSAECGAKLGLYLNELKNKQTLKKERGENRKKREQIKSLSSICKEAQEYVNRFIRIRDKGKPCISCGSIRTDHAGHYYAIGSKYQCNRLRFEEMNIHAQCAQCNLYLSGNLRGYREGLINRYGIEYLEELEYLRANLDHCGRLTKAEALDIKKEYMRRCKNEKG